MLPDCYTLYYPDTVNSPFMGCIIKGDSIKLRFSAGGVVRFPTAYTQENNAITFLTDTINNFYLRQIGIQQEADKYHLMINVVDIRPNSAPLIDGFKYTSEISASTDRDVSLTKKELDMFIRAFKNMQLKE